MKKVNIAGIECEVVANDEESETQPDFVVCNLATNDSGMWENQRGTCVDCGRAVIFRPHAPKRPPRICLECWGVRAQKLDATEVHAMVNPETVAELRRAGILKGDN